MQNQPQPSIPLEAAPSHPLSPSQVATPQAVPPEDSLQPVTSTSGAPTSPSQPKNDPSDAVLADMLQRIQKMTAETQTPEPQPAAPSPARPEKAKPRPASPPAPDPSRKVFEKNGFGEYVPIEPVTFEEAGTTPSEVEALVLKFLLTKGEASGRAIAEQIKMPFALVEGLLRQLKQEQMVGYRDAATINDYIYILSGTGRDRARRYDQECTYYGATPVTLNDYRESIRLQSLQEQNPSLEDLQHAFRDLLISEPMMARLGPAVNSGRGMFLFGYPGNGKTSIAERVTRCFGETIWIPRALGVDGEIIRVFDPNHHEELPLPGDGGILDQSSIDKRWIRIRRPTIIAGGELTMDNLEISVNYQSGINEAPLQLKSNCGTLVIDDFGRQKMSTDELLNRWIVPLEKRYDFLNLPSGKKIEVPFDQLVVFSTNLEPKDLVDDAFLRRIPYKIEVCNPTETEFRQLFEIMCPKMGCDFDQETIDHLIQVHYLDVERPFRCCQPRDLLLQVKNMCLFRQQPMVLNRDNIDFAVQNYFAIM